MHPAYCIYATAYRSQYICRCISIGLYPLLWLRHNLFVTIYPDWLQYIYSCLSAAVYLPLYVHSYISTTMYLPLCIWICHHISAPVYQLLYIHHCMFPAVYPPMYIHYHVSAAMYLGRPSYVPCWGAAAVYLVRQLCIRCWVTLLAIAAEIVGTYHRIRWRRDSYLCIIVSREQENSARGEERRSDKQRTGKLLVWVTLYNGGWDLRQ